MMRKRNMTFLLGVVMCLLVGVQKVEAKQTLHIKWENQPIQLKDSVPYIHNDNRAYVPVRSVFEHMGFVVHYDERNKTVSMKKDSHTFLLYVDKPIYEWNGKTYKTTHVPHMKKGRVYIPIRYWSEKVGILVRYEKETKTIYLTEKKANPQPTPPVAEKPIDKTPPVVENTPTPETPVVLDPNEVKLPEQMRDGCYVVETIGQLQAAKDDLDGCFTLENDINATYTEHWNEGKGFEPVGTEENPFTGIVKGNGYKVKGLWIHRPTEDFVGLLNLSHADIQDIHFEQANVTGNEADEFSLSTLAGSVFRKSSGVLAGFAVHSTITDSSVKEANVNSLLAGGIIGTLSDTTLQGISATSVTLKGYYSGGLFAYGSNQNVVEKIQVSNIIVREGVRSGGVAGLSKESTVSDVTANNIDITATSTAGGVFGYMSENNIVTNITAQDVKLKQTNETGYAGGISALGVNIEAANVSVTNAIIEASGHYAGGIFGVAERVTLTNLAVANSDIRTSGTAGGLLGFVEDGTVSTGSVENTFIKGGTRVHEFIGEVYMSTVTGLVGTNNTLTR